MLLSTNLTFQSVHKLLILVRQRVFHLPPFVGDIEHRMSSCLVLGVCQVCHELVQLAGELVPKACIVGVKEG